MQKNVAKKLKHMNKKCMTFKPDGASATLKFDHNMGTKDVIVQAYDPNGEEIGMGVIREENSVSLLFSRPPEFDVRVVVIG